MDMDGPGKQPYGGPGPKLVLGIDVGTTFSGLSYALLEPGIVPQIRPVTQFEAHEHSGADSKVPSIVWYDRTGKARACGAEAVLEEVEELAAKEKWKKAEWFKLHLRPNAAKLNDIPPLPPHKKVVEVFADFYRYLYTCAKAYITTYHAQGSQLWIALEGEMEIVLTHPNGWGGVQQQSMRAAAVAGGMVPNLFEGHRRIRFITEGEASLNYCINNGLATDPLRTGKGVIIVDAGGGTVDITAYHRSNDGKYEEIAAPRCLMSSGAVFVTRRAHAFLRQHLSGSKFAHDVDHIAQCFDKSTKLRFRTTDMWSYIKFGRSSDNNSTLNISNGQLKLAPSIVAGFFQPSFDEIAQAIANICETSDVAISSVLLVGGFGASHWLFSELQRELSRRRNLEVSRPDSHVNKAVADGAVSFSLDHFVTARVARETFGIECAMPYDPHDKQHQLRSRLTKNAVSGEKVLHEIFSPILMKNTRVSEMTQFRKKYVTLRSDLKALQRAKIPILAYQGPSRDPYWMDVERPNYRVLCTVEADTSRIRPPERTGSRGTYYSLEIEVILSFGLTELIAEIAWDEQGVERRSPAQLLY
ncbi:hypothetical protein C8F01DRAFT_139384 [Mycena amicta]|nr:hypothetical protein C8F01DRAFT_139384 [Mycena amicta]